MRSHETSPRLVETRNKLDQENWNGYGLERMSPTIIRLLTRAVQ